MHKGENYTMSTQKNTFLFLFCFVGTLFSQSSNPPNIVADTGFGVYSLDSPYVYLGSVNGYETYQYTSGSLSGILYNSYIKNIGGPGIVNVIVKVGAFTENKQFTVQSNYRYKLVSNVPGSKSSSNENAQISISFNPGTTLNLTFSYFISFSTIYGPNGPITNLTYNYFFPSGVTSSTLSEVSPLSITSSDFSHSFKFNQNCPELFVQGTTISFYLPSRSFVSLKIIDLAGKVVTMIESEELSAGIHSQQWNAPKMSNGVYFYCLQAGSFSETKKLFLAK
jgi:hypothetical protein